MAASLSVAPPHQIFTEAQRMATGSTGTATLSMVFSAGLARGRLGLTHGELVPLTSGSSTPRSLSARRRLYATPHLHSSRAA